LTTNTYNQRKWAKAAKHAHEDSQNDNHELEQANMKNAALTAKYDSYKTKNDRDLKDANDKNKDLSLETEMSKNSLVESNAEVASLIHKTTSLRRQNEDLQVVCAGHSSSNERKQLRICEKSKIIEKLEEELDHEKVRYMKAKPPKARGGTGSKALKQMIPLLSLTMHSSRPTASI